MTGPTIKDKVIKGQEILNNDVYTSYQKSHWGLNDNNRFINTFLEVNKFNNKEENIYQLQDLQIRLKDFIGKDSKEVITLDRKRLDAFTKLNLYGNRSEYLPLIATDPIPASVISRFDTLFEDTLAKKCRIDSENEYFRDLPDDKIEFNESTRLIAEIYNLSELLFSRKTEEDMERFKLFDDSEELETVALLTTYLVIKDEIMQSGVKCDLTEFERACAARIYNFIENDIKRYKGLKGAEKQNTLENYSLPKLRDNVIAIANQIHNALKTKVFKDEGYFNNFFHDRRMEELFVREANGRDLHDPVQVHFIDGLGRVVTREADLIGETEVKEFDHSKEDTRTTDSARIRDELQAVELVRYISEIRDNIDLYNNLRQENITENLDVIRTGIVKDINNVYGKLLERYQERIETIKNSKFETETPTLTSILDESQRFYNSEKKEKLEQLEKISALIRSYMVADPKQDVRFEQDMATIMDNFNTVITLDEKLFETMDNATVIKAQPRVRDVARKLSNSEALTRRVEEVTREEVAKIISHSKSVYEAAIKDKVLDENGELRKTVYAIQGFVDKDRETTKDAVKLAFPSKLKLEPYEMFKFIGYALVHVNDRDEDTRYYFNDEELAAGLSEESLARDFYKNSQIDYHNLLDKEKYFDNSSRRERLLGQFNSEMKKEDFAELQFMKESALFRQSIVERGKKLTNNQEDVMNFLRDIRLFCGYIWERDKSGYEIYGKNLPSGKRIKMIEDSVRDLATAMVLSENVESLSIAFNQLYRTCENILGKKDADIKIRQLVKEGIEDAEIIAGKTLVNTQDKTMIVEAEEVKVAPKAKKKETKVTKPVQPKTPNGMKNVLNDFFKK